MATRYIPHKEIIAENVEFTADGNRLDHLRIGQVLAQVIGEDKDIPLACSFWDLSVVSGVTRLTVEYNGARIDADPPPGQEGVFYVVEIAHLHEHWTATVWRAWHEVEQSKQ